MRSLNLINGNIIIKEPMKGLQKLLRLATHNLYLKKNDD